MKEIARTQIASGDAPYRHDVGLGRHTMIADGPAHAGGADAGPAPYELLLASLGSCTAITLQIYTRAAQAMAAGRVSRRSAAVQELRTARRGSSGACPATQRSTRPSGSACSRSPRRRRSR